jgi:hypothetical protein
MESGDRHDVKTTLKFLQWQDLYSTEKPFQIIANLPGDAEDKRLTNLVWEDKPKIIQDVRGVEDHFGLDDHGFMFLHHASEVSNFADKIIIETEYLPEVEALLRKNVNGVDRVSSNK